MDELALWHVTATMHPDPAKVEWRNIFPAYAGDRFDAAKTMFAEYPNIVFVDPAAYAKLGESMGVTPPEGAFAMQVTVPAHSPEEAEAEAVAHVNAVAATALAVVVAYGAEQATVLGSNAPKLIRELSRARAEESVPAEPVDGPTGIDPDILRAIGMLD